MTTSNYFLPTSKLTAEWATLSKGPGKNSSNVTVNSNHSSIHVDHCPSYVCEISNLRTPPTTSTSGAPRSTSMALNHHLELFIFLEDTSDQEISGLGKNCQWKRSFELHHKLREAFQSLVVINSKKFHRAVHSALNKFICNYGSHAKVCIPICRHHM